jgi:hypothetical protein
MSRRKKLLVVLIIIVLIGLIFILKPAKPAIAPVIISSNNATTSRNILVEHTKENLIDLASKPYESLLGFSINPPIKWQESKKNPDLVISFVNPISDQVVSNLPPYGMSIDIKNYGNTYANNIDDAKNAITAWLSRNLSNFQSTSSEKITNDNFEEYILQATYKNGTTDMNAEYLIVTTFDGKTFLISAVSTRETWDRRKSLINKAISTFKID